RGEDGGLLRRPAERRRTGERNELAPLEPTCGDEDVGPPVSLDDGSAFESDGRAVARLVERGERRPRGGFRPALNGPRPLARALELAPIAAQDDAARGALRCVAPRVEAGEEQAAARRRGR